MGSNVSENAHDTSDNVGNVPQFPIPRPNNLIIFSPHPDDVAISLGGLVVSAVKLRIPASVVQVTDGSEARMTQEFLSKHGWTSRWSSAQSRRLRGSIRIAEAQEEMRRLGVPMQSLKILERQLWNSQQLTSREAFNPDGSINDVDQYKPGPVDRAAISEICETVGQDSFEATVCGVPEPDDALTMHRMTTAIVLDALLQMSREMGKRIAGLMTYRCLSTKSCGDELQTVYLPFDEPVMSQKCHAIRAHQSMLERRRVLGGYSNSGHESYDVLVKRWNRDLGVQSGLGGTYAEAYGWVPQPSLELLENLRARACEG